MKGGLPAPIAVVAAFVAAGLPVAGAATAADSSSPAAASPPAVSPGTHETSALELSSDDGNWKIRLKGRVQVDTAWVSDSRDATSDGTPSGVRFGSEHDTEVRSAQIGIQGEIHDWIAYRTGVIRVAGETKLTSTYVEFRIAPVRLTLGQMREAVSMEEQTGAPNSNFLERAAFTDAWGYRRRLGIGVGYETRHFVLETALQSDNLSQEKAERDRYAMSIRAIYLPLAEKSRMVHIAAYAMRRRNERTAPRIVQYDQRPEVHPINQRFVDTGILPADGDRVLGLELAGLSGPLNATAEASFLKVDSLVPAMPDPKFTGGYVEFGYFLTGEMRPYRARNWGHVTPLKPIGSGGFGAIQVLIRIDYVDLEDAKALVFGGRQTAYLLGLNWHPVDYVKLMANLAAIRVVNGPYFHNPAGHDTVDVLGLRGQINW